MRNLIAAITAAFMTLLAAPASAGAEAWVQVGLSDTGMTFIDTASIKPNHIANFLVVLKQDNDRGEAFYTYHSEFDCVGRRWRTLDSLWRDVNGAVTYTDDGATGPGKWNQATPNTVGDALVDAVCAGKYYPDGYSGATPGQLVGPARKEMNP